MNNKAFNVSLSLTENYIRILKGLVQYDTGNLFRIKVMSGSEAFDFSGYTSIVMAIMKPDGTSIVEDLTTESETLQSINAEAGEIAIQIGGQATVVVGMHFMSLSFYGDGLRTTTAKLNYYVQETDDIEYVPEESTNSWTAFQSALARLSEIETQESIRVLNEQARIAAEEGRAAEAAGLIATATTLSNAAQTYAEMARNWAAVAFATCIPGEYWQFYIDENGDLYVQYDDSEYPNGYVLPAVTEEQLDARLAGINCGVFNNTVDQIQILRGPFADMPLLEEGEMAWATDQQAMYIGTDTGNVPVGRAAFLVQATEPTENTVLWIDTANGNALKFYDGANWVGTATATFA